MWNCSPLEEVRVLQDEERGEVEYVSCADCFAFFLFVIGGGVVGLVPGGGGVVFFSGW